MADILTATGRKVTGLAGMLGWVLALDQYGRNTRVYDPDAFAKFTGKSREELKLEPTGYPGTRAEYLASRVQQPGYNHYIFDYARNAFVPATQEQVTQREKLYQQIQGQLTQIEQPGFVAPPGVPGAISIEEYETRLGDYTRMVEEQRGLLGESFAAVFPGQSIDNIPNYLQELNESPELRMELFQNLNEIGRTPQTELLLQTLFPEATPAEIGEVFGEVAETPQEVLQPEPQWENIQTGEILNDSQLKEKYPKGWEPELDNWRLTTETSRNYWNVFKIFGESLTKLPRQLGASILQAIQGQWGASVVNQDWADQFISDAQTDINQFAQETSQEYSGLRLPIPLTDLATLPQSMAFSLTSMTAGLAVGVPIALIPEPTPASRVAAWATGTVASGAVAFNMASYQIMQSYLEVKNEEMKERFGRELTIAEENQLKKEFSSQATKYGLWEAVPEALSNLAFAKLLTMPLGKMVGRNVASKMLGKIVGIYGEELLTETITQKGQSAIEVQAGLRKGNIGWVEAFKEIAPQTFLLTTILGGLGDVGVKSVSRIKQSLKTELAENPELYEELKDNINEEVFSEVEADSIAIQEQTQEQVEKKTGKPLESLTPEEITEVANKIQERIPVTPEVTEAIAGAERVTEITQQKEVPTTINLIRDEHEQIKMDIATVRESIKGKTDVQSRLTRQVLANTERELSIAERLLSRVETAEEAAGEEITNLRDRLKASIKLAQSKAANVQEYKQALVDFVGTLPQAVKSKMLASVKNVRTEVGLEKAANRAIQLTEEYNQKTLKSQIIKELKKAKAKVKQHILKGRFTPEVQRRLDVLSHNLSMDRDAAREKMVANIEAVEAGTLSYEDMLSDNELLNYAGIDGMSAEELANTLDYIKQLEQKGRSLRQVKQEADKERIGGIRENIINILTGGKGLKAGVGAVSPKQLAAKPSWIDTLVNWQYGVDNLADKLSKLDPTSQPYQSAISKLVATAHRAMNSQLAETKRTYNKLVDAIKEVYNIKSKRDLNNILNALDEEVDLGTFELTPEYKENNPGSTTVNIKMTRNEMIAKYMQMQDATLDRTFTVGMGWSQKVRDAISNALTEQEKKLSDALFTFYEDYYQTINPIYQELFNIDMPHNPSYSPIRRDFNSQVAENILTLRDAANYASVLNGSLKSRQANVRPLKFNGALQIIANHIEQMEHFKAWATTMRDLRRVFGSKQVRQAIEQYHGRGINQLIDNFLNQMARGGVETAATNRVADYLRRAFTKSILAIKPVILLKQIPSLFAYVSEMKVTEFVSGIADFWTAPVKNFKFLMENSDVFRARMEQGFERDIRAAMQKHGKAKLTGARSFTDWFILQIRLGDTFAVTQGMWAKYKAGLKAGLTNKEAIVAAEDTTNRTQPSFGIDTLSAIQNGGSWLKLMTMFQNQPNKYFRIIGDNLRNFRYGRGSRAKAASTVLLTWVLLPMMFQFISDAFQFKPEREARAAILGPLNYILIGGQLVQSMWGWLTKEPFDYQVSPVVQTFDDLQRIFTKARSMIDKGNDPYKDITFSDVASLLEYVAKAGGQVSGLPTPYFVQLEKLLRTKFEEGEELTIKDFLFSQWALEPPPKTAEQKVEDANLLLGEVKPGQEDKSLSEKELQIYDTSDWFRDIGNAFSKTMPQDVLNDPKAAKESKAWAAYEIARSQSDILPNIPLYKINTDDNDDTIINYYQQWQARQKLDTLLKIKEFDNLYPKAYLGNVTRQQYNILKEYLEADDKEAYLEAHPELKVNPRKQWLENHPTENAYLVLGGQADILSQEAYNEFKRLQNELDIPDSALPEQSLPPESSLKTHWQYLDMVAEDKNSSWEAQLLMLKDAEAAKEKGVESYADWADLELSDTPIEALEIKVKNRQYYDEYGELETDEAREEYRLNHISWMEDKERVEAIEKGGSEYQEKWVERWRITQEHGDNSSEAKLWLLDNPDIYQWAIGNELLKDNLDELKADEPVIRINVQYAQQDELYNSYSNKDSENYIEDDKERAAARERLLKNDPAYNKARYQRQAYQKDIPAQFHNDYISWYTNTTVQRPDDYDGLWFEDDWWLIEHKEFYAMMVATEQWQERDFNRVPSREVFALYQTYTRLAGSDERLAFRRDHPELDEWGQVYFGWKPAGDRIKGEIEPWRVQAAEYFADLERRIAEMKRGLPR